MIIDETNINSFTAWLAEEEHEPGTIGKYRRDLTQLCLWLDGREFSKENLIAWKNSLSESELKPATVNSKLASCNSFCRFLCLPYRLKYLRVQKRLFRERQRELDVNEYRRLIAAAENAGNFRLARVIETIGSTGIRVCLSENGLSISVSSTRRASSRPNG